VSPLLPVKIGTTRETQSSRKKSSLVLIGASKKIRKLLYNKLQYL